MLDTGLSQDYRAGFHSLIDKKIRSIQNNSDISLNQRKILVEKLKLKHKSAGELAKKATSFKQLNEGLESLKLDLPVYSRSGVMRFGIKFFQDKKVEIPTTKTVIASKNILKKFGNPKVWVPASGTAAVITSALIYRGIKKKKKERELDIY